MTPVLFFLDNDNTFFDDAVSIVKNKYEVIGAKDLRSAYNILDMHKDRIDVIILDIMMDSQNVFNTTKSKGGLKSGILFFTDKVERKIYKDIAIPPTIFITAYNDIDDLSAISANPNVKGIIKKHELKMGLVDLLDKINDLLDD